MECREPCGAEFAILLLRVLQDQQRNRVLDRHDALANAKCRRLEAARAIRNGIIGGCWCRRPLRLLGHPCHIRLSPGGHNAQAAQPSTYLAPAVPQGVSTAGRVAGTDRSTARSI